MQLKDEPQDSKARAAQPPASVQRVEVAAAPAPAPETPPARPATGPHAAAPAPPVSQPSPGVPDAVSGALPVVAKSEPDPNQNVRAGAARGQSLTRERRSVARARACSRTMC